MRDLAPPPRHVSDYSGIYDPERDFDVWLSRFVGRRIAARLGSSDQVLEIGCATGVMTELLAARCKFVHGIERSPDYVARFQARRIANAEAIVADIESHRPARCYDHVVATGMLGNLRDAEGFVRACRQWLLPGGKFHLSVANPKSLHRLAAIEMGLIANLTETSAANRALGNRNFTFEEVETMARAAGFRLQHREGVLVKPLPNAQMATLPAEVIEGLDKLSRHLPEFCAVTYFVFGVD